MTLDREASRAVVTDHSDDGRVEYALVIDEADTGHSFIFRLDETTAEVLNESLAPVRRRTYEREEARTAWRGQHGEDARDAYDALDPKSPRYVEQMSDLGDRLRKERIE